MIIVNLMNFLESSEVSSQSRRARDWRRKKFSVKKQRSSPPNSCPYRTLLRRNILNFINFTIYTAHGHKLSFFEKFKSQLDAVRSMRSTGCARPAMYTANFQARMLPGWRVLPRQSPPCRYPMASTRFWLLGYPLLLHSV